MEICFQLKIETENMNLLYEERSTTGGTFPNKYVASSMKVYKHKPKFEIKFEFKINKILFRNC